MNNEKLLDLMRVGASIAELRNSIKMTAILVGKMKGGDLIDRISMTNDELFQGKETLDDAKKFINKIKSLYLRSVTDKPILHEEVRNDA